MIMILCGHVWQGKYVYLPISSGRLQELCPIQSNTVPQYTAQESINRVYHTAEHTTQSSAATYWSRGNGKKRWHTPRDVYLRWCATTIIVVTAVYPHTRASIIIVGHGYLLLYYYAAVVCWNMLHTTVVSPQRLFAAHSHDAQVGWIPWSQRKGERSSASARATVLPPRWLAVVVSSRLQPRRAVRQKMRSPVMLDPPLGGAESCLSPSSRRMPRPCRPPPAALWPCAPPRRRHAAGGGHRGRPRHAAVSSGGSACCCYCCCALFLCCTWYLSAAHCVS